MVNGYGVTVEIAFLTREYSDTPTFRHQSQLSQEKFHPRFHTVQEIHVRLKHDFDDVLESTVLVLTTHCLIARNKLKQKDLDLKLDCIIYFI